MSEEFVKIPYYVERDGTKTHFLPGLRQGKGFRIGEKYSEQVVSDYWEALALVRSMSTPRFRRKNSAGNAGSVACKPGDVEEVSKRAIDDMIASMVQARAGEEE